MGRNYNITEQAVFIKIPQMFTNASVAAGRPVNLENTEADMTVIQFLSLMVVGGYRSQGTMPALGAIGVKVRYVSRSSF